MSYVDLNNIHDPATGTSPPAAWGDQVRDNFEYFDDLLPNGAGAWSTWTPTLVQSSAVAKTVTHASYVKIGRLVIYQLRLTLTGSGTTANPILVGLPVAAAANLIVGSGLFFDSSTTTEYNGVNAITASTTTMQMMRADATAISPIGQDPSIAAASGDVIVLSGMYEAAA